MVSFGDVVGIRSVGIRRVSDKHSLKRGNMIFDGMWKWEIKKQSNAILFWQFFSVLDIFAEHQLTKAVLYSAIVTRKIIEDSKEIIEIAKEHNWILPKDEILGAKLEATKFPFVGDDVWYMRGKVFTSEYGSGEKVEISSREICNWLVHSYCWGIAKKEGRNKYYGFLIASDYDKVKYIHFISFKEWRRFLELVVREACI